MTDTKTQKGNLIELSQMSEALLDSINTKIRKSTPLEGEQYKVSETVSFFGFMYEKIRNAVEFNEEHLIRRLTIARILRRRLAMNKKGTEEGENLARELLWGRYIPADTLSQKDVVLFQKIIDSYILFLEGVKKTHNIRNIEEVEDIIIDLMSTELEEAIGKQQSIRKEAELYFFYQTLVQKIELEDIDDETRDTYFFVAAEKALAKNDTPFIMYHLFKLRYGDLSSKPAKEIHEIAREFHAYLKDSQNILKNPFNDRLTKFAQRQTAPFRILYTIIEEEKGDIKDILTSEVKLKAAVERVCKEKYDQTGEKLRNAAIRSITYIFLTKMIFVLIFEVPLTQLLYGHIEYVPIGINTLFPPLLMGAIVSVISPPSAKNTSRIYDRIVNVLDSDPSFETKATKIAKNRRSRRPILLLAFTVIYLLVFFLVFGGIYLVLDVMNFNIISKAIFVFFISVVTFFAYRIRQTAKEFVLDIESNVLVSFATFLFLPILYVGKFLSNQVARINVLIIFFDYLIEAPFKFIIEIVEEWTRFLKARKDELV